MTIISVGDLPLEILLHLITFFDLPSFVSFTSVSTSLHRHAPHAYRHHALTRLSFHPITSAYIVRDWSWRQRCRLAVEVERNFRRERWRAGGEMLGRQPGQAWTRKCMPVIHLWKQKSGAGRIVIGKGTGMEIWSLDQRGRSCLILDTEPLVQYPSEGGTRLSTRGEIGKGLIDDITGITSVDDDHLLVSRVSGSVAKVKVIERDGKRCTLEEKSRYSPLSANPTIVQAVQARDKLLFTATASRARTTRHIPTEAPFFPTPIKYDYTLSVHALASPWLSPTAISLPSKPWSLLISPNRPAWLATGLSGVEALSVYSLSTTDELLPHPRQLGGNEKKSAVYGLCSPTSLSTTLRPDTTLIAGFYDSVVRLYDLRSPSSLPIAQLSDQWNDDPIYSLSSGGPTGSYIITGKARNATLQLFDIRADPNQCLTIFAPGKDQSPVYGVEMEFGRIWGVSEKRGFVIDLETDRSELDEVSFCRNGDFRLERTRPARKG